MERCQIKAETTLEFHIPHFFEAIPARVGKEFPDTEHFRREKFIKNKEQR